MLIVAFIECIGNRDTVKSCIFGVGNIGSVCIKNLKNWFWRNSRIHRTSITKKDYELYREIVQIGHQKDFDPIANDKAPADVVAGNKIERKKMLFPLSFIHWFLTCELFNAVFFSNAIKSYANETSRNKSFFSRYRSLFWSFRVPF